MGDKYKLSGWAMTLLGIVKISTFIVVLVAFEIPLSVISDLDVEANITLFFIVLMSVLVLICGVQLIKQNHKIHRLALPVSIILLLGFPIGTIVGGLYLLEWRRNT